MIIRKAQKHLRFDALPFIPCRLADNPTTPTPTPAFLRMLGGIVGLWLIVIRGNTALRNELAPLC